MKKNIRAFIIALISKDNSQTINDEIQELKQLSSTRGYDIVNTYIQKTNKINSNTYIGKGKITSIINQSLESDVHILIFNNELKPSHFKNINKLSNNNLKIIDRTKLILDIFENHAKTNESKKQIQLAMNQYMLPRLKGLWTHLERQMGGVGTTGGPGEKQIEIDKRLINRQITKLKRELKNVEKSRNLMRKNRKSIFKICLVGYTNAGKSSIMKELSGFDAFIKNQLFVTLDTTTRKIKLKDKYHALLSDTVGFLNNLPHSLIASFKSTLEEIKSADLIIKVLDINAPHIDKHFQTINNTLTKIGVKCKHELLVFNKIDLVKNQSLFQKISKQYNNPLMISVKNKLKINNLIESIVSIIDVNLLEYDIAITYNNYELINFLHENVIVLSKIAKSDIINVKIKCTKHQYLSIINKIKNP